MYRSVSSVEKTWDMATTKTLGDVEFGNRQNLAADQPAPPIVLEQARLGNLDLFRTELEGGNHPLDFKAGSDQFFNRTPLHLAAMEGHEEIVEFILSCPEISREVVNAKDCFGYTPLHLAVRHSHENIVRLLTTSSWVLPDRFLAATNEPDDVGEHYGGYTPLHLAAVSGHIAIAKLLLQQPCQLEFSYNPVNICAMTWDNSTPLDLARLNECPDLGDFLEASDMNWLQQERTKIAASANAVLVGAALVVTAAFGAWLQPPPGSTLSSDSGSPSPSPSASSSSLSLDRNANISFYVCVMFAFSCSVVSLGAGVLAAFPNRKGSLTVKLRRLRRVLKLSLKSLLLALIALFVTFARASALVFDKVASGDKTARVIVAYVPLITALPILMVFQLWA